MLKGQLVRFNPRAPCGARPGYRTIPLPPTQRFNPRAPCGARRQSLKLSFRNLCVSIHAPRAGRDNSRYICLIHRYSFNPRAPCGARRDAWDYDIDPFTVSIHAPRAGRDGKVSPALAQDIRFQSTRPVRGATGLRGSETLQLDCFNPRAPCGARQPIFS